MSVVHNDPVVDLYCVAEALRRMADNSQEADGGQAIVLRLLGERVNAIACSFDDAGYRVTGDKRGCPCE